MINHSTTLFFLKLKRKLFSHPLFIRKLFKFGGLIVILLATILVVKTVLKTKFPGYVVLGKSFLMPKTSRVDTYKGRLNILVMGKGGLGHESPDLTDTMMLVSIGTKTPNIKIISIPRDVWIPSIRAKINSAYYWGNQKQPGGGLVLSKNLVEEIVGVPVEYAAVADFSIFKEVIDTLGGVKVIVDRGFVDNRYPIAGRENMECPEDVGRVESKKEFNCRYETVTFEKGVWLMNGETALKFARSRYAQGDEGTDLARDLRQQKVMTAIKDQILTPKTYLNFKKILALKTIAVKSIETDVKINEAGFIARKILDGRKNINSYLLDEKYLEHPEISPRYDKQYVFIPIGGNWDQVKNFVASLYSDN
jgi:polyisoprenyl-teichoic acid--peptidoglycan teichoic acid transferase